MLERTYRVLGLTLGVLGVLFLSAPLNAQSTATLSVDQPILAPPGQIDVPVVIQSTSDQAFQGFSIALSYPSNTLTITALDYVGTVVDTILGGAAPAYSEATIDNNGGMLTLGVIFDTNPISFVEVPATVVPVPLVNLTMAVNPSAIPGNYTLDFANGLGTPPISNVFSSDGQSIAPQLSDGIFEVINLYAFTVRPVSAVPGTAVDVIIECTNDTPIDAYQIAFTFDKTKLFYSAFPTEDGFFECLDVGNLLGSPNQPGEIEVAGVSYVTDVAPNRDWLGTNVLFDFAAPFDNQQLPADDNQSIARFRFQTINNPADIGSSTAIEFDNTLLFPGSLPFTNLVVLPGGGAAIIPVTTDGAVSFVTGTQFMRGDVDADGDRDLIDGLDLLNYLFNPPFPAPGCFDSADISDDGSLGITDTIYLINYLFLFGCAIPPPDGCGIDTTDTDSLGCASYPNC